MPVTRDTRVLGGPDLLEAVCRVVGRNPDKYIGFALLLISPVNTPDRPHNIVTDAPDREQLAEALQQTAEVLRGER